AQLEKRREGRPLGGEHQDAAAGVTDFSVVFLISAVVFTVASLTASLALVVVSAAFSPFSVDVAVVAASGAFFSVAPFELLARLSVLYQPDPLKMIGAGCMIRLTATPVAGSSVRALSLNPWR